MGKHRVHGSYDLWVLYVSADVASSLAVVQESAFGLVAKSTRMHTCHICIPANAAGAVQMALTRENTAALNAVSSLTAAQRKVETGLSVTRKTMFADPDTQRRKVGGPACGCTVSPG
jgi:hypothetical protein